MSELTLTQALKEHSRTTHDSVDSLVMSAQPFASQDNYRKFLQVQYEFHRTVSPIYHNKVLAAQFDGLAALSRLERLTNDMQDLNVEPYGKAVETPQFNDAEAIGWLYCAEGSNVGAAILYKEAGKIELTDSFGASHLAAHPDGRMPHWRSVKAKIDALPLSAADKKAAMKGADDAFAYYKRVVRKIYGINT
ncbi:MAG: biliverdin-producing heme oxygenase [Moraxella sp.]|nr:biliverdin-producing heme oxygenase [Moraxella sp.]